MRVYYSHAMTIYGTQQEKAEKKHIMKNIPKAEIVDPGSFQDNPAKQAGGMEYCLKIVEECDRVVFTRFLSKITAGVGKEINHALKNKIQVHELKNEKLRKVNNPVKYLTREDTVRLYRSRRLKQMNGLKI